MSLCEKNIDCLQCTSRGMCSSYAIFKYNEGYNKALDEAITYFTEHAKEIYNHVSARDFICDRLEGMKL